MLKMQMILRIGNAPIWMKEIDVSDNLNHKFTNEEIEEAMMTAEEYLATIVKNQEVVKSPGGTG